MTLSEERQSLRSETVSVSVVLPCRNEEGSVAGCIAASDEALSHLDGDYEVIVVDNGSSDASRHRATAAGAWVVYVDEPGYGNACRAGLSMARGRIAVLADADGTYDLSAIPALVEMVEKGAHLALGSRLRGRMEQGAMPWLHRMGTPVLTGLINRSFGTGVSDVNCGIRAIDMDVYHSLGLSAAGMEFASEMVVRSAQLGLRIEEMPVDYARRRTGEPKLRTWRDGWRHLNLVLRSRLSRRRATGSDHVPRLMVVPELEPGESIPGD